MSNPNPRPSRRLQKRARSLSSREGLPYQEALRRLLSESLDSSPAVPPSPDDHHYSWWPQPLQDAWLDDQTLGISFAKYGIGIASMPQGINKAIVDAFADQEEYLRFLVRLAADAGHDLSGDASEARGRLVDGSRAMVQLGGGGVPSYFILTKTGVVPLGVDDLIGEGVLDNDTADMLSDMVREGRTIIVSGGTAAGKTTLLNALAEDGIAYSDRIATIERRPEFSLTTHRPVIGLTYNDTDSGFKSALERSLYSKASYVLADEIRGSEAGDLLNAAYAGVAIMTTQHAANPREALQRLALMINQEAQVEDPSIVEGMIATDVDVIVHIRRDPSTGARRVSEVLQVLHPGQVVDQERYQTLSTRGLTERVGSIQTLPLKRWSINEERLATLHPPMDTQPRGI